MKLGLCEKIYYQLLWIIPLNHAPAPDYWKAEQLVLGKQLYDT